MAPISTPKMNAVVRVVSRMTAVSTGRFNARLARAKRSAPRAPTPAASVGVASPKKMLPSTAAMRSAGGTMAFAKSKSAATSTRSTCRAFGAPAGRAMP